MRISASGTLFGYPWHFRISGSFALWICFKHAAAYLRSAKVVKRITRCCYFWEKGCITTVCCLELIVLAGYTNSGTGDDFGVSLIHDHAEVLPALRRHTVKKLRRHEDLQSAPKAPPYAFPPPEPLPHDMSQMQATVLAGMRADALYM